MVLKWTPFIASLPYSVEWLAELEDRKVSETSRLEKGREEVQSEQIFITAKYTPGVSPMLCLVRPVNNEFIMSIWNGTYTCVTFKTEQHAWHIVTAQ